MSVSDHKTMNNNATISANERKKGALNTGSIIFRCWRTFFSREGTSWTRRARARARFSRKKGILGKYVKEIFFVGLIVRFDPRSLTGPY